jgi:hypothetical protein
VLRIGALLEGVACLGCRESRWAIGFAIGVADGVVDIRLGGAETELCVLNSSEGMKPGTYDDMTYFGKDPPKRREERRRGLLD